MKQLLTITLLLLAALSVSARGKYDNTDTLVVSHDQNAEFHSVQEAIEVCRAFMEYKKVIFIKKGVYKEKIVIPSWLTNIELVGEDRDQTIITWADHANMPIPGTDQKMGTFRTYTVKIEGTNITLRNLTIENDAPRKGQAVTLHTEGTRLAFVNCRILGNQDTVYTGQPYTSLYFFGCRIEGTTDFIFGPSTAWFEQCDIYSRVNSYITAASTPQDADYGYVFNRCHIIAADSVSKVYLGRPWRAYAYTLFKDCQIESHILPEGWHNWPDYHDPAAEGIVRYMESGNKGKGAKAKNRVAWSRQLTKTEAGAITPDRVFHGDTAWIPL